ncbi:hypothetical protein LXA43DRAFT_1067599 [Ganoderma leucocontextum]|nr:hypothetical protein LXA43DRAFT_1067599 [Ganoderma leucocontextum]
MPTPPPPHPPSDSSGTATGSLTESTSEHATATTSSAGPSHSATSDSPSPSNGSTTTSPSSLTEVISGSSEHPSQSKSKGKKGKQALQPEDGAKAPRRSRVEWNNYPVALAKLEAQLGDYQALDGRTQQTKRGAIKDNVTEDIFADDNLKKTFRAQGFTDGDIRQAVHAWYKNHLGKKERGGAKPRANAPNPLWKAMAARGVSPMRLWASNNGDLVVQKAGPAARDIGARSKAGAELWRELPPDQRGIWEQRAEEHSKDKVDQCYLNQHLIIDVLGDYLSTCIGFEGKQMGMCAFVIKAAFRAKNGVIFHEELSVKINTDCPSFAKWKGGYSNEDNERWNSWAEEAVLDADRPGHMDWSVITQSPRDFVAERWVDIFTTPLSQRALLDGLEVWRVILKAQRQGYPFRFQPVGASGRKTSVSVKNTPSKGPAQKHKIPLALDLLFDKIPGVSFNASLSEGSQATTPTTPVRRGRGHLLTNLSMSDVQEEPEETEGSGSSLPDKADSGATVSYDQTMQDAFQAGLCYASEFRMDGYGPDMDSMASLPLSPLALGALSPSLCPRSSVPVSGHVGSGIPEPMVVWSAAPHQAMSSNFTTHTMMNGGAPASTPSDWPPSANMNGGAPASTPSDFPSQLPPSTNMNSSAPASTPSDFQRPPSTNMNSSAPTSTPSDFPSQRPPSTNMNSSAPASTPSDFQRPPSANMNSSAPASTPSDFPSQRPPSANMNSSAPTSTPSDFPSQRPPSTNMNSSAPASTPSDFQRPPSANMNSSAPASTPSDFPSQLPPSTNMNSSAPTSTPSDFPSQRPPSGNMNGGAPASTPSDFPSQRPPSANMNSSAPASTPSDWPPSANMNSSAPTSTPSDFPSQRPPSGNMNGGAPASTPSDFPSQRPPSGNMNGGAPASTPSDFPSQRPPSANMNSSAPASTPSDWPPSANMNSSAPTSTPSDFPSQRPPSANMNSSAPASTPSDWPPSTNMNSGAPTSTPSDFPSQLPPSTNMNGGAPTSTPSNTIWASAFVNAYGGAAPHMFLPPLDMDITGCAPPSTLNTFQQAAQMTSCGGTAFYPGQRPSNFAYGGNVNIDGSAMPSQPLPYVYPPLGNMNMDGRAYWSEPNDSFLPQAGMDDNFGATPSGPYGFPSPMNMNSQGSTMEWAPSRAMMPSPSYMGSPATGVRMPIANANSTPSRAVTFGSQQQNGDQGQGVAWAWDTETFYMDVNRSDTSTTNISTSDSTQSITTVARPAMTASSSSSDTLVTAEPAPDADKVKKRRQTREKGALPTRQSARLHPETGTQDVAATNGIEDTTATHGNGGEGEVPVERPAKRQRHNAKAQPPPGEETTLSGEAQAAAAPQGNGGRRGRGGARGRGRGGRPGVGRGGANPTTNLDYACAMNANFCGHLTPVLSLRPPDYPATGLNPGKITLFVRPPRGARERRIGDPQLCPLSIYRRLEPLRMPYDLRKLPLPYFIPGPRGSWVVPAHDWSPTSIWELVVTTRVFIGRAASGPRRSTLMDSLGPPPMQHTGDGCLNSQTAYMDPCYFTAMLLPPTANEVAVLPTIEEEGELLNMEEPRGDDRRSMQFLDVGVQTSDDGLDSDASYEDSGVQTSRPTAAWSRDTSN